MTILSTGSSNAIKLFPGKGKDVLLGSVSRKGDMTTFAGVLVSSHPNLKKAFVHVATIVRCPEAMLIFLSMLCVYFVLLSFRVFDDNRLTSWQWIFAETDLLTISICLIFGLLLAWYLSAINLSCRFLRHYAVTALFILSFVIGMSHWDSPEVIVDASRYFTQAKYLEIYGIGYFLAEWGRDIMAWTDLPLVPFIYGLIFQVFGENRVGIQIINTFFFSGTVVITYFIGKCLWNQRVGLYGAAMLLAIPYLHTQVPLMLVDVAAMFFLSLALLVYIKTLRRNSLTLQLLAATAITLALLTKYSNWLMLSVLPIIAIIHAKNLGSHNIWRVMARQNVFIIIGLSIFVGLLLLWNYGVFVQQIGLLMNYQLPALGGWSESHLSTFLFQVHPFVTLAALASLYFAYRKRDLKYLIIGWMLILVLVLDIRRIRYVLITFPMLALMAGYALSHIKCARIRRYLVLCIIASSTVFSSFGYATFLETTSASNIKHAGEYVNSLDGSVVEVVTLPQTRSTVNPILSIPLFDLFTHKQVIYGDEQIISNKSKSQWMERSPLRFSWEYDLPSYYLSRKEAPKNIIAVISNSKIQKLPRDIQERLAGFYLVRRFDAQEGIFRYTTIVDVYVPVQGKNKGMASM